MNVDTKMLPESRSGNWSGFLILKFIKENLIVKIFPLILKEQKSIRKSIITVNKIY